MVDGSQSTSQDSYIRYLMYYSVLVRPARLRIIGTEYVPRHSAPCGEALKAYRNPRNPSEGSCPNTEGLATRLVLFEPVRPVTRQRHCVMCPIHRSLVARREQAALEKVPWIIPFSLPPCSSIYLAKAIFSTESTTCFALSRLCFLPSVRFLWSLRLLRRRVPFRRTRVCVATVSLTQPIAEPKDEMRKTGILITTTESY